MAGLFFALMRFVSLLPLLRLCMLAAKSTRWNPLFYLAGPAFSRIDSTGCASTPRATQLQELSRVSIFSSFRFPETKSAHLKFSPLSNDNPLGG